MAYATINPATGDIRSYYVENAETSKKLIRTLEARSKVL
jgi:hypothetical protein